jgi:peptidoglycan-associated lipoprotein
MKKLHYLLLFTFLGFLLSDCANYYHERANEEYNNWNYPKAIRHYEKAMEKKTFNGDREKLAFSYRQVKNLEQAADHYQYAADAGELSPDGYFHYASTLMESGKHRDAVPVINKYLTLRPHDLIAIMMLESCHSIEKRFRDTTLYTLTKISTPQFNSVFGAIPFHSGLLVVADKTVKKTAEKNPWTGASFLDFYFLHMDAKGQWCDPQLLASLDGPFHEGPATFTNDQNTIFFTRSCYGKKGLSKNCNDVSHLYIYSSRMVDGMWATPESLPFNSEAYSCGHPSLSEDETTMYFISDMPGGFGGTDIYKSVWTDDKWSEAINLGREINTPGNEMFPFIHPDGTLYFSSDAHCSMGGLDIFKSRFDGERWSRPENMDAPLNSVADDFSFMLMKDNKTGFLSSSREGGKDVLYSFKKNPPTFMLYGTARVKGTDKPVEGAMVTIKEDATGRIIQIRSNEEGKFKTGLDPENTYNMHCVKQGYYACYDKYSTMGLIYSENFYVEYEIEEVEEDKPIVIPNIYYEYNKWDLLPASKKELDKLVKLLTDNPTIEIELSAHTDHRGSDSYNMTLSQKRAQSAVDYIISNGVHQSRIKAVGYGETKPVINCVSTTTCTEDDFLRNRRTEFKVTKK